MKEASKTSWLLILSFACRSELDQEHFPTYLQVMLVLALFVASLAHSHTFAMETGKSVHQAAPLGESFDQVVAPATPALAVTPEEAQQLFDQLMDEQMGLLDEMLAAQSQLFSRFRTRIFGASQEDDARRAVRAKVEVACSTDASSSNAAGIPRVIGEDPASRSPVDPARVPETPGTTPSSVIDVEEQPDDSQQRAIGSCEAVSASQMEADAILACRWTQLAQSQETQVEVPSSQTLANQLY